MPRTWSTALRSPSFAAARRFLPKSSDQISHEFQRFENRQNKREKRTLWLVFSFDTIVARFLVDLLQVFVDNVLLVVALFVSADLLVSVLHGRQGQGILRSGGRGLGQKGGFSFLRRQMINAIVLVVINRLVMNEYIRLISIQQKCQLLKNTKIRFALI